MTLFERYAIALVAMLVVLAIAIVVATRRPKK